MGSNHRFAACKAAVIPLDHGRLKSGLGRTRTDSLLLARQICFHLHHEPFTPRKRFELLVSYDTPVLQTGPISQTPAPRLIKSAPSENRTQSSSLASLGHTNRPTVLERCGKNLNLRGHYDHGLATRSLTRLGLPQHEDAGCTIRTCVAERQWFSIVVKMAASTTLQDHRHTRLG